MTYDHELTLIGRTTTSTNAIGDTIKSNTPVTILCGLKSVGRSEFYQANANGLKPERIFVVHTFEYEGQQMVEFEGVQYKVIRAYSVNTEETELTCTGQVIGGD